MPLHLGLNSHSHSQDATREARRLLQQKVRNDWDYPLAPHPNTHITAEAAAAATATSTKTTTTVDAKAAVAQHSSAAATAAAEALDFQAVAWREREYSENESSASEDERASGGSSSSNSKTDPKRKQETVAERKQSRKRRRMNALEEEMGWNIGLANYSAQRNAWTGARTGKTNQERSDVDMDADNSTSESLQQLSNDDLSQRPPAIAEDATVSLPVAPKLLPDNPVRAIISPSSYAEIYNKVILQGRTPTVPINLQDVTNAMVYGWKEEGNWPPKVAAPEQSIATSAANKKKAATTTTDGRGTTASGGNNNNNQKHPHFSKGVHAVAKVLHNLTSGPMDSPRHHHHA